MLKRIIISLFILTISSYAGDDLQYHNDTKTSLTQLLSYKKIQVQDNLTLSLDLSSVLFLVDDSFQSEESKYLEKTQAPDKVFVTLSYKF
ncbi:MAG: hypothetical protein COA44_05345 [Arcobacter sp.]|nr:MAG: hypothetical protein COA44_05345 [Arcobacter sp.]